MIGWLVVLWRINPFRVIWRQIKFQTIQFDIIKAFVYKQLNVKTVQLKVKIVLFQAIQFIINTPFSSVWATDRTLSGANTPGQSGPGNDSNERVLCIP